MQFASRTQKENDVHQQQILWQSPNDKNSSACVSLTKFMANSR